MSAHQEDADAVASWSVDVSSALQASRRTAIMVVVAATVLALLEAAAIASLSPLQSQRVSVMEVDRETGYIGSPVQLDDLASTSIASRLALYVIARESHEERGRNYLAGLARSWSRGDALAQLSAPSSDFGADLIGQAALHPTQVNVVVTSVRLDTPTSAAVRFQTTRLENGVSTEAPLKWIAHLSFETLSQGRSQSPAVSRSFGLAVSSYAKVADTSP